jgi:hypothetical protein
MKRKKGVTMKSNSFIILFTTTILGLITYGLLNNIQFSLLVLLLGMLFFYISKRNTLDRKENLNIIRDEKKLYFYLSDDLLFSVNLAHNQSIAETLREAINRETASIRNITRKICFINFREDKLLDELNSSLISKRAN